MAATPATGKTHSRHCRLILGGYNLSGDARSLGGVGINYDPADVQGWQAMKEYINGFAAMSFGPFSAVFDNTAGATGPVDAGVHVLSSVASTLGIFAIGIGQAPEIGSVAFGNGIEQLSYVVSGGDGAVMVNIASAGRYAVSSEYAWGNLLGAGTSISATTNHESFDSGASSTDGAIAILGVSQSVGAMGTNNWAFKIQDSPDDGAWADVTGLAFTADGSTVEAERLDVSVSIDRYVRLVATKTAGTDVVPWLVFIRK